MKKILIILAAVAAAVGIYFIVTLTLVKKEGIEMPRLSVSDVETILEKKKPLYEEGGFSYAKEGSHYTLVAQDEQKVRKFLIQELVASLPSSYRSMLGSIESSLAQENTEVFKGMSVDMDIVEDTDGAKIEVTLKALPASLSKALLADKKADSIVTDFLAKGGFSYKLAMNKKGEIQGIELRDINEEIKSDAETVKVKLIGTWIKMVGDMDKEMSSAAGVKEFSIAFDESAEKSFSFAMNDIVSHGKQTGIYDQEGSGSVGSIKFDIKEFGDLVSVLLDGITLKQSAKSKDGFFDAGFSFDTKRVASRSATLQGVEKIGVNIDKLLVEAKIEHMNIEAIEELQKINNQSIPAALTGMPSKEDPEAVMAAVQKMLKSGLSFHINALNSALVEINIGNGMPPMALHNLKFDLHTVLLENSLDMSAPMAYMPFIKIKGKIEIQQSDLAAIGGMMPMAGMILDKKKIVGDQAVFEFAFDQGQFTINGQPLQ